MLQVYELTPWPLVDMIIRLLIASIIGGAIGYERARADKPAGLRTHLLVCLGSALFTIASLEGFGALSDPSRIAAGIVTGVGFLGAGTILRGDGIIVGLTTAASIWTVAAIGLAVGAGLYVIGAVTGVIILIALRFPVGPRHG